MVPPDCHVRVPGLRLEPISQDLLRPKPVAAVNDVHRRSDVREIERLLHRRISAPDHGHRLVLEEEAVAGRAGRYAGALVPLFRGKAEVLRRRPGGDDERIAGVDVFVAGEPERPFEEVRGVDVVEDRFGVEALRVGVHPGHQVRSLQSLHIAWPVVDVRGGRHLSTHLEAGDHDRIQVRARRVQGRRATGRPRAEDEEPAVPGGGMRHVARLDWIGVRGPGRRRRGAQRGHFIPGNVRRSLAGPGRHLPLRLSRVPIQGIISAQSQSGNSGWRRSIHRGHYSCSPKRSAGEGAKRPSPGSRRPRSSSRSRYRAITAAIRAGRSETGRSTSSIAAGSSARGSRISCSSFSATWHGSFRSCSWSSG